MAKRKKKFSKATRTYNLTINKAQYNTLQIFKKLRPDLNSGQAIMEYAYSLFWRNFDDMFISTYKLLDTSQNRGEDDMYAKNKKVIIYRHYLKDYKTIDSKIDIINKRFNVKINRAEYFRRMLIFMLSEYNLFNSLEEQPLLQDMPDDINEFINNLDSEYKKIVLRETKKAALDMNTDDKTLSIENQDDKTLDIENEDEDDKTLNTENEDDKTLYLENIDDITIAYEDIDDLLELLEN